MKAIASQRVRTSGRLGTSQSVNALLSLVAWAELAGIAIGGFFLQAPLALVTLPFDPGRKVAGRWVRLMAVAIAKTSPFWQFEIHGDKPRKPTRPTVVVSNHVSNADPFLISFLPWEMKWMVKKSLTRIPIVGWLMWIAGDVPVKRGDAASAREALDLCRKWIARGVPVMMFPEGTRSKTGELLPFKDGAFKLAIEAGADVLPIAVAGTRRALPKHSWRFAKSRGLVTVGEPISTQDMTLQDLPKLKAAARAQIEALASKLQPLTDS